jgi:SAM-dependent methyltransferase
MKRILEKVKSNLTISRHDYQVNRLNFLSKWVELKNSEGLEIGACDLPTVPTNVGNCEFADFRSAEEMIRLWSLPPETVVPVTYILQRDTKIHLQINKKFDYVVLCHVIEHIPNPIGYIQDLQNLLNPGGVILIACPDKRRTPDASRPSTSLEHLLNDYYNDCNYPSLEHILECAKAWSEDVRQKSLESATDFYDWGRQNFESGLADAHCHVWRDEEFFTQIQYLIDGNLLKDLRIVDKFYNDSLYNEFLVILKAVNLHSVESTVESEPENVKQLRSQLQKSRQALHQARAKIAAMETSKFWKLRLVLLKLKKMLSSARL